MARFAEILSKGEVFRKTVLIFLTVGNWHKGFDRLVEAVDALKGNGDIQEEVIAQIGSGNYKPKHLTALTFCSPDRFAEYVGSAGVIIAHAGIGVITCAIRSGKTIIVVPRKASLGEISNDHQITSARVFESERKILVAYDVNDILPKLKEAENFVPADIVTDNAIIETVDEFISGVAKAISDRRWPKSQYQ